MRLVQARCKVPRWCGAQVQGSRKVPEVPRWSGAGVRLKEGSGGSGSGASKVAEVPARSGAGQVQGYKGSTSSARVPACVLAAVGDIT